MPPTVEHCVLNRQMLQEIHETTSNIAIQLFGSTDPDSEKQTGRLPTVEASAKAAHERIGRTNEHVTKIKLELAAYAGGLAVIVFVIDKIFGR